MLKKYLTLGMLALVGVAHADDYPEVNLVGLNPITGAFATVEGVIRDGSGAVQAELKIFQESGGMEVYAASTFDLNDDTDYKTAVEHASKELLKNNAKQLAKYGIDLKQKAELLYEHSRTGSNEMVSELVLGESKNILLSVKEVTPDEGPKNKYWELYYSNPKANDKAQEFFLFAPRADEVYPDPNVGFQKVYLVKAKKKYRLLVLTSRQTQGYEGPNVNFMYSVIDL